MWGTCNSWLSARFRRGWGKKTHRLSTPPKKPQNPQKHRIIANGNIYFFIKNNDLKLEEKNPTKPKGLLKVLFSQDALNYPQTYPQA
jgi:hypothetical protein